MVFVLDCDSIDVVLGRDDDEDAVGRCCTSSSSRTVGDRLCVKLFFVTESPEDMRRIMRDARLSFLSDTGLDESSSAGRLWEVVSRDDIDRSEDWFDAGRTYIEPWV